MVYLQSEAECSPDHSRAYPVSLSSSSSISPCPPYPASFSTDRPWWDLKKLQEIFNLKHVSLAFKLSQKVRNKNNILFQKLFPHILLIDLVVALLLVGLAHGPVERLIRVLVGALHLPDCFLSLSRLLVIVVLVRVLVGVLVRVVIRVLGLLSRVIAATLVRACTGRVTALAGWRLAVLALHGDLLLFRVSVRIRLEVSNLLLKVLVVFANTLTQLAQCGRVVFAGCRTPISVSP